jgi:hypothetical protein
MVILGIVGGVILVGFVGESVRRAISGRRFDRGSPRSIRITHGGSFAPRRSPACLNPPEAGEYRLSNQFTDSFSVEELARFVIEAHPGRVEVEHLEPPRVEQEQHYFRAAHTELLDPGLAPHLLGLDTVASLLAMAERHRDRVDPAAIRPSVQWRATASDLPMAGRVRTPQPSVA